MDEGSGNILASDSVLIRLLILLLYSPSTPHETPPVITEKWCNGSILAFAASDGGSNPSFSSNLFSEGDDMKKYKGCENRVHRLDGQYQCYNKHNKNKVVGNCNSRDCPKKGLFD